MKKIRWDLFGVSLKCARKSERGSRSRPFLPEDLLVSSGVCCAVILLLALQPLDYVVREKLGNYTHSECKQKVCY